MVSQDVRVGTAINGNLWIEQPFPVEQGCIYTLSICKNYISYIQGVSSLHLLTPCIILLHHECSILTIHIDPYQVLVQHCYNQRLKCKTLCFV